MTAPEKPNRPLGGQWTRRGVLAGLLGAPALFLAACDGGSGGSSGGSSESPLAPQGGTATPSSSPKASVAKITVRPANGTTDAPFGDPVKVTVTDGSLRAVALVDATGAVIPGQLSPDASAWTSTGPLVSGTKYTVSVIADDHSGREADANTSFATATPASTFVGYFTPEDGSTVGVGMPISIRFNKPVTNRAAVQRAISVVADPGVEVVGHWFSSTRLDFRPQQYWAKGTKVTLSLRLKDVEGTKGVYGIQSKDVTFTIGRSQTSVADLAADTLTVTTDGKVTAVYPVIGGSPEHRTWGGKLVISEQFQQTKMDSATVGLGDEYNIPDVPHAQRLTASGTFIHGNYWSPASQFGKANTSHGCISLRDVQGGTDPTTNAARFYASSLIGDVVEVVNSGDKQVDPANGLNGWNMTWTQWKAGSAV
ncbi:Ig-like domain-containing protein [Kitasatospora sp. MBT63]|uniref:L,D-transpeptidase n=1 Tax=Kitasatospora sp. MBT63 TaxID=1444768 RepID=UPI00053B4365|nr:Ig-like domain-containing protein [Kitasatospora sp. MBT63]